jgi:hypothetical protein
MMLNLSPLQLLLEYKNLGSHQARHIHVGRDLLLDGPWIVDIQLARFLVQALHDRCQYEFS